jgi:quercetin dioxygenase-like cupin family protein
LKPLKNFNVFGEPVDVLTDSQLTGGKSCALIQTSPPGGGPPPHLHQNEDETFFVLEGSYEFLSNGEWKPVPAGETVHSRRGSVHTFRNAGSTIGRMLVFVAPAGLEKYLEEVSPLSVPNDMPQILAISARYGISFTH